MAKRKRPSLKKALKKVDEMPENLFGSVDIDIHSLPCLNKPEKEKITANFDADLLKKIRATAKSHEVSYTALMNDVLRQVFLDKNKTG